MDLQKIAGMGMVASMCGSAFTQKMAARFDIYDVFRSVAACAEFLGNVPGIEMSVEEDSSIHNFAEEWAAIVADAKAFSDDADAKFLLPASDGNEPVVISDGSSFYRFTIRIGGLAAIWKRHTARNLNRYNGEFDSE